MIVNTFPKIVKDILRELPKNDYPVLNTRLFFECWLSYVLDQSITSMLDLFKRLNNTGIDVDISTFSKASSQRVFEKSFSVDFTTPASEKRVRENKGFGVCDRPP